MATIPIKSIHYLDDGRITDVKLISNDSLLDADILLWNIDNTFSEIPNEQGIIEKARFDRIVNRLESRKKDFAEFLERGRILIIEIPIEPIKRITVLETSEKKELNLLSMIDIDTLPVEHESGEFTTISENKILQDFTYNQRVIFRYKFRFKSNIGDSLLYINKTSYSVGQFIQRGSGYILLLPPLLHAHNRATKDAFIGGLFSLKDRLPKKVDAVKLETPKWVENYFLEGESEELQKLETLESQLRAIDEKILHQKRQLELIKDLKLLVYGSGEELERIVETVFTDLGFRIHEKEYNRDELIISMNEKTAVIEIKGLKGSAGRKECCTT